MNAPVSSRAWTGTNMISINDPQPDNIHLIDIAVGLSRENRYGGSATVIPWSVTQHTRLAMHYAESDGLDGTMPQLMILFHDAPEYMLRDMISPVKRECPDYKKLEKVWDRAIARRFNLPYVKPGFVKHYDMLAASSEKESLISPEAGEWPECNFPDPRPIPPEILNLTPTQAAIWFREKAIELLRAWGLPEEKI